MSDKGCAECTDWGNGNCDAGCFDRGRCSAAFSTPYGDRRCDLRVGHSGYHIRNDGSGRPEYYWGSE